MSLSFLADRHLINIVTVLLATFAGLYGYYGILGRPGGILRQVLVGIPMGIVLGVGNYLFDIQAHELLSHTAMDLLQTSTFVVTPFVIGVIGFVGGLIWPILSPNFFRGASANAWQKTSVVTIVIYFLFALISGTFWTSIALLATLKLVHPWLAYRPPLPVTVVAAAAISSAGSIYGNYRLGVFASQEEAAARINKISVPGCLLNIVVLIPTVGLFVYLIQAIGWGTLLYFVLIAAASLVVVLIQFGADHLKPQSLQAISLILFLLGAGLQLYQAIAL